MLKRPNYFDLPKTFYAPVSPTPKKSPALFAFNQELADDFGMNKDRADEHVDILAGAKAPNYGPAIALAYCGHQFGHFAGVLGDGRAALIGQMENQRGERYDIQLKGSGQTKFSRRGDGRATLGAALREYIVGEAMNALGITSTRGLAVLTTGEPVFRERMEKGAVMVRAARSHIRVGSYEYAVRLQDDGALKALADFTIKHHFPELNDQTNPYRALLQTVISRQARLVASWMGVGFIHGVMNTDNMSITGETVDYGPCAFLDTYQHDKVFSSIDHHGRYAYNNQASIALWNLTRFAESLLDLIAPNSDEAIKIATAELEKFAPQFTKAHTEVFARKLGIDPDSLASSAFIQNTLQMLHDEHVDFTLFFSNLNAVAATNGPEPFLNLFTSPKTAQDWLGLWQKIVLPEAGNSMQSANPVYIPRNHKIAHVIRATESGDKAPFLELMQVLKAPYSRREEFKAYESPPRPEEEVQKTFCGT